MARSTSSRPSPTRRRFLGIGTASAAAVALGTGLFSAEPARAGNTVSGYPFALGVASGEPRHNGVVLWTRLAPEPLAPDGRGGMDDREVTVYYQVATDEDFRRVVREGSATASPELAHSVHPEVSGLRPDREYFYRFGALGEISPVGRTRTAPPPGSLPSRLEFGFVSCQNWNDGHYTAYRHLADEDLAVVLHLGDYIYENPANGGIRQVEVPDHLKAETVTLEQYRSRYSLYKTDPDLRAAHERFPWIVTPDDHEVDNNWAGEFSQDAGVTPERFLRRRAAAFQAYYENLPLRRDSMPIGPNMSLHRRLPWGRLADFTMLDTRQYRDDQACGDGLTATCEDRFAPGRSVLGEAQRDWLVEGFANSPARWHVLGNQMPMLQTDVDSGPDTRVWMDAWDGYVAERDEVLAAAVREGVRNLVVLTGDRHQNYAADLKADYTDPDSATVGTEFVGTSISSSRDGQDLGPQGEEMLAANPHLRFVNEQRGYVRCTVTPRRWETDFRVLPYVTRPDAPVSTRASLLVEDGRPGVLTD
ncbi:alkaline phosphatase D family protein [Actinorugispora endophytica]|uniref:Alkaline phosphatase D n=1 Tax=Actinorugispora endophytica TaxID=1605990 RepID=A0A4R6UL65_9ACTN|nr:alkaline phosphatase D family protein [Actinorugispora endophytica]TDQ46103.1 alkaline phosphatase D [Actinorugispora endophytica]